MMLLIIGIVVRRCAFFLGPRRIRSWYSKEVQEKFSPYRGGRGFVALQF